MFRRERRGHRHRIGYYGLGEFLGDSALLSLPPARLAVTLLQIPMQRSIDLTMRIESFSARFAAIADAQTVTRHARL